VVNVGRQRRFVRIERLRLIQTDPYSSVQPSALCLVDESVVAAKATEEFRYQNPDSAFESVKDKSTP
jgi:hypothetical protein